MDEKQHDINVPTQEQLLKVRMNGILPIIDIAGHPFYVDVHMNTIRPHDDFASPGIPFSEFKDFECIADIAWFFYDPKKHEIRQDIDIQQIFEIPKDWILIEIPLPCFLDPYGFAQKNGWNVEETLKMYPIQHDLKARIVPWEETSIPRRIKENTARLIRKKNRPRFIKSDDKTAKKARRR